MISKTKKGIILAGGLGTRLWPLTKFTSKQLLPIYDKPLIYYPLTTLMLSGIKDVLIITNPEDQNSFINLLGDGSSWGMSIQYEIQKKPSGIVESFIIGAKFINNSNVTLILGDNIFYGSGLSNLLTADIGDKYKAKIFSYYVSNPNSYGVSMFDEMNNLSEIVEKPDHFISNWVVTGLYSYTSEVVEIAKTIKPSKRNELEISTLNNFYLNNSDLEVVKINRGFSWLDAGTPKSLLDASNFVETIESRQGLKIGCPEEVAYRMNFITLIELENIIDKMTQLDYSHYLRSLIEN